MLTKMGGGVFEPQVSVLWLVPKGNSDPLGQRAMIICNLDTSTETTTLFLRFWRIHREEADMASAGEIPL
jgi:hypothetical protein